MIQRRRLSPPLLVAGLLALAAGLSVRSAPGSPMAPIRDGW
jgi:hypothetical protein